MIKYYLVIRKTDEPEAIKQFVAFSKKYSIYKKSDNRYEWDGPRNFAQTFADAKSRIWPFTDFILVAKAPRKAAWPLSNASVFSDAVVQIQKTLNRRLVEKILRVCEADVKNRSLRMRQKPTG